MRAALITALSLSVIALGAFSLRPDEKVATPRTAAASAESRVAAANTAVERSRGPFYRVVKVVDGDTVTVDIDGAPTTLRLIGLDTPETVDPRTSVQCFGKEASSRAKALLENTFVRLEYDDSQGKLDKYGRTLAYLYLEDGTLFNQYMIAEGYGHEYTYGTPYRYQVQFKAAEAAARAAGNGLWADGACVQTASTMSNSSNPAPSGAYECSRNAYNCSDFSTQSAAQTVYDACGHDDIHKLDSDGDGEVCESLP